MTPEKILKVIYDSFAIGDMEKFASVLADDCVAVRNGVHVISRTYEGRDAIMKG
tara:strand:+ start:58 stop:219 length:162 start_codon:yes stop_codon:yes gene_type:complete